MKKKTRATQKTTATGVQQAVEISTLLNKIRNGLKFFVGCTLRDPMGRKYRENLDTIQTQMRKTFLFLHSLVLREVVHNKP